MMHLWIPGSPLKQANQSIDPSSVYRFLAIVVKPLGRYMSPQGTLSPRTQRPSWRCYANKQASVFRMHCYSDLCRQGPEKTSKWSQHKGMHWKLLGKVEKMLWKQPRFGFVYRMMFGDLNSLQIKSNFLASMSHELRTPFRWVSSSKCQMSWLTPSFQFLLRIARPSERYRAQSWAKRDRWA